MTPVVLSGGSGSRLWPVSRSRLPKQFCQLFGDSLQTLTLQRSARLGPPLILTSKTFHSLTEQNLRQLNLSGASALYEPQAKNTAPAIAFLCQYLALNKRQHEVVAILPADHLIENETEFLKVMKLAEQEAENGKVVTLGIKPDHPATGYGYIQTARSNQMSAALPVLKFHEKPEINKAKEFVGTGDYFWNAGIFVFKVSVMAELFALHAPDLWTVAQQIKADLSNLNDAYSQFRNISIDYAIMEKLSADVLYCLPADIGWSDVGSWDAVATILQGKDSVATEIDSKNNFVHPQKSKVYALIGVEDLIVVDTRDALMIAKKGSSQEVKTVVDNLKASQPQIVNEHTFEGRPWGNYEVLKNTDYYKSKSIEVSPYQQISYQSHAHREEHWMFIRGQGEVVLDDKVIPVVAGTYVKIPLGAKHRIRNTGADVVEFIELQLGTYFGEDDITRYQDDYQRI